MASESSNPIECQMNEILKTFKIEPSEKILKSLKDFLTDIFNQQKNQKTETEYQNNLINSVFGRDFPFWVATKCTGHLPSKKGYKHFDEFHTSHSDVYSKYPGEFIYYFQLQGKADPQFKIDIMFKIKYDFEIEADNVTFDTVSGEIEFCSISVGKSPQLWNQALLERCYDFISKRETRLFEVAAEYDISFQDLFEKELSLLNFSTSKPSDKKRSRTK